jgi:hypothetical protein
MAERYKSFFSQPKNMLTTKTIGGKTTTLLEVALTNGLSNYLIPLIAKYNKDEDYLKGRGWANFVDYLKQVKKYYENNSGQKGLTFTEILQSEFNNPLLNAKWKKMRAIDKGKMMNFVKYIDENPDVMKVQKTYKPREIEPIVEPEKVEPIKQAPKPKKNSPAKKIKRAKTISKYRK